MELKRFNNEFYGGETGVIVMAVLILRFSRVSNKYVCPGLCIEPHTYPWAKVMQLAVSSGHIYFTLKDRRGDCVCDVAGQRKSLRSASWRKAVDCEEGQRRGPYMSGIMVIPCFTLRKNPKEGIGGGDLFERFLRN